VSEHKVTGRSRQARRGRPVVVRIGGQLLERVSVLALLPRATGPRPFPPPPRWQEQTALARPDPTISLPRSLARRQRERAR
jgi:hypothetical protein